MSGPAPRAPGSAPRGMLDRQRSDRAEVLRRLRPSPAVERRLDIYVELLGRWNATTNLVAPSTVPQVWSRHILDSAQLLDAAPEARRWLDIGAGGGFPGMALAILLSETEGVEIHCVDSDKRKCAFLSRAAAETGAPARVHPGRVETFSLANIPDIDIVTARGFGSLSLLLEVAQPWLAAGARGLFLRGESWEQEIAGCPELADYHVETRPSWTHERARVVSLRKR